MGKVLIKGPQKYNLEYYINDLEPIVNFLERNKKRKSKSDKIIGIWKDRFDANISSEQIQSNWRSNTWKRDF